jgi:putative ABC transport system substrate-binding protein
MMKRRDFIAFLGSVAIAVPSSAAAQSSGRSPKIGILVGQAASDPEWVARFRIFTKSLQELGWEDGRNISFEIRHAVGDPDQFPGMAAELVAAGVNILVVGNAGLAILARRATKTVPIVVLSAGDLQGIGLVADLRRPGGNVTGIQLLSPELMSKRLDLLRQLVPNLTRVGFVEPVGKGGVITPHYMQVIIEAAEALRIQVHRVEVHSPGEFASAFHTMAREGDEAAIVASSALTLTYRNELIGAAAQSEMPAIYEFRLFASSGGLISYGPDFVHLAKDATVFVDKILRGANPADLPVQQPTQFELVVNLKTAKALGLVVPATLLAIANEVIE